MNLLLISKFNIVADSIEANVESASAGVEQGTEQLRQARQHQVATDLRGINTCYGNRLMPYDSLKKTADAARFYFLGVKKFKFESGFMIFTTCVS